MDWDNSRVTVQENNKHLHWSREAIETGKRSQRMMNRDESAHMLSYPSSCRPGREERNDSGRSHLSKHLCETR